MLRLLIFFVTLGVRALRAVSRTREELLIEDLALRHQVTALKRKRARPVLDDTDRCGSRKPAHQLGRRAVADRFEKVIRFENQRMSVRLVASASGAIGSRGGEERTRVGRELDGVPRKSDRSEPIRSARGSTLTCSATDHRAQAP